MKHKTIDRIYRLGFWPRLNRKMLDLAAPLLKRCTSMFEIRPMPKVEPGTTITIKRPVRYL